MINWRKLLTTLLLLAGLAAAVIVVARSSHPFDETWETDESPYYGFLGSSGSQNETIGPIEYFVNSFASQKAVTKFEQSKLNKIRPYRQWRRWANSVQNPLLTFLFTICFSIFFQVAAPSAFRNAEQAYRIDTARSCICGLVATIGMALLARAALLSGIGWPAGIVLIGALLSGLFAGLAVAAAALGKVFSLHLSLDGKHFFKDHKNLLVIVELLLGSLIVAASISIPGCGPLPQLGTRLVTLLAIFAFGALLRSRRERWFFAG